MGSMLSKVLSAAVHGIDGYAVTVEVDISAGLPSLATVGLPDAAVKEARDRVASAVRNSGYDFPIRKVTVNLAPADIRKEGASFDLPIAIGILAASEAVKDRRLGGWCLVGELALDGTLRPVKGILPIALAAQADGLQGLILPRANHKEARVVRGLKIFAADKLGDVVEFLNAEEEPALRDSVAPEPFAPAPDAELDFAEVKGQAFCKRALEVACAGGHNVAMVGPPGSGKTMLSRRLVTILPPITFEESIETTKIHSVAGFVSRDGGLVGQRPFRSPHHTISAVALVGGGQLPRPGEISLAHNGVLFLDELPEFHRDALEVLRQPLESRKVVISRARDTLTLPASFMLVAAMNPCPCGYRGHPSRPCVCTPFQVQKYAARISGPLLDRIDIHLEVPALRIDELTHDGAPAEPSAAIRERVQKARETQRRRFKGSSVHCNAQMSPRQTRKFCALDGEGRTLLKSAVERLGLSARAFDRILKVARTVADLEGSEPIRPEHLAEAIRYRTLDRTWN